MSRLTDLIAQTKSKDPQLGADLDVEFKQLSSRLPFGLNFERHRPEAVELPQRPIRKGDKVPTRGSTKKGDPRLWQIRAIRKAGAGKVADLELLHASAPETRTVPLDELVVVVEFRRGAVTSSSRSFLSQGRARGRHGGERYPSPDSRCSRAPSGVAAAGEDARVSRPVADVSTLDNVAKLAPESREKLWPSS